MEEINRGILELLYTRYTTSSDNRWLKRDSLLRVLDVEDDLLEESFRRLVDNGIVEVDDFMLIRLSDKGIQAIEANITSHCPHL